MLSTWLAAAAALACGGFFGPPTGPVFSDAQIARFDDLGDEVSVEYGVAYVGDPTEFGWIVPIPGPFVRVEEADGAALAALVEATDPRIAYHADPQPSGCRRGKGDLAGGTHRGNGDSGVETRSGVAGVFAYTAIRAADGEALLGWLADHGWTVGESGPSLDAYVAEGWEFVALTLTSEFQAGSVSVRLVYGGDQMVFPARMSRYSTAEVQRTTILVVGDREATMSGWSAARIADLESVGDTGGGGISGYDDALADLGGTRRGYGLAWSGPVPATGGSWVTRFDALVRSEVHDEDPAVALDAPTSTRHEVRIDVYGSEEAWEEAHEDGCACRSAGGAPPGLPIAAVLAMARRRRRGGPRGRG